MTIRPATDTDLPAITAIYGDAVLHGTSTYELEPPTLDEMTARFRALQAGGFPYLVSVDAGGTVQGYAYAGAFRARPAYRFIAEDSVYIAPAAKGQGVGEALVRALVEVLRAQGYRQVIAVIGDGRDDSPSVRLHRKLGFESSGALRASGFKHGRWLDTVFMQLPLNGGGDAPPDPQSWPERRFRGER